MHAPSLRPSAVAFVIVLSAAAPLHAQATRRVVTLTLNDAIEAALAHGHTARAAEAARSGALARADAVVASLLPQLSLSGSVPTYNRSIIEVLQPDGSTLFRPQNQTSAALTATLTQAIPFTGGNVYVSSSLSRLSVSGAQDILTWQSTPVLIGFRQPLFRPNAIGWSRRERPYQVEAASRQYLEAREDIALQTTAQFFALHSAEATLANSVLNVAVNDTLYRLNTGRYDVGSIGENDLLQSQLALLRARTAVDAARLAYARAEAQLQLALGLPANTSIELIIPDSAPSFEVDTARAVEEALRNGSVASDLALQRMEADRRVSEARLNAGFGATLQASYGFNATGPEMSAAYQNLLEARRVTLSLDVPLWQWGAGRATVHAAEADRDQARNAVENTLEQTALDARFAALDLAQARRNLALSATADTVARNRFAIAYNRYGIGRISVDNLYIAQNEKDQARTAYVQALGRYWQAYYRLRRVTLYDFERGEPIR